MSVAAFAICCHWAGGSHHHFKRIDENMSPQIASSNESPSSPTIPLRSGAMGMSIEQSRSNMRLRGSGGESRRSYPIKESVPSWILLRYTNHCSLSWRTSHAHPSEKDGECTSCIRRNPMPVIHTSSAILRHSVCALRMLARCSSRFRYSRDRLAISASTSFDSISRQNGRRHRAAGKHSPLANRAVGGSVCTALFVGFDVALDVPAISKPCFVSQHFGFA